MRMSKFYFPTKDFSGIHLLQSRINILNATFLALTVPSLRTTVPQVDGSLYVQVDTRVA